MLDNIVTDLKEAGQGALKKITNQEVLEALARVEKKLDELLTRPVNQYITYIPEQQPPLPSHLYVPSYPSTVPGTPPWDWNRVTCATTNEGAYANGPCAPQKEG